MYQSLSLEFSNLNYANPAHSVYRYRLEGLEKNWTLITARPLGRADYNYLQPGKYTFTVMASNNGVEWSEAVRLPLTVKPPFYKTIWARILISLAGLLFLALLFAYLYRRQLHRLQEASAAEQHRQEEELNQMKFRFFTNISHELRTPLSLIILPLESLMKEKEGTGEYGRLKTMHRNAKSLLDLVNHLLDFRKVEMGGEKLQLRLGSIREFAENLLDAFRPAAEEKEISLSLEDPLTGAERLLELPYTALVRSDPTSVTLSGEAFRTDTGSYLSLEVGTGEENTTGRFIASVAEASRGKIDIYAPLPGEETAPERVEPSRWSSSSEILGGRLLIRVGERSGDFSLSVFPAGNPDNGREVRVSVRTDIALRLKGSFSFYGEAGRRGWFGFPGEVTAELVTYRGTGGGSRIERFDSSVGLYSLDSSYDGPLEVDFIVSVSNTARGNHLFAAYEHLAIPWRELIWYDHDWKWTTLPSQLNTLIQERSPKGSVIACESLATLLRRMDGKALEWCTDTWNNHSDPYDESAAFGTFRIDVTRIVYDREHYRLRYVLNLFEVPSEWGGEAPWWAAIPPERSVVIPWND